jgi:hypothetical protein
MAHRGVTTWNHGDRELGRITYDLDCARSISEHLYPNEWPRWISSCDRDSIWKKLARSVGQVLTCLMRIITVLMKAFISFLELRASSIDGHRNMV